jgi:hypothetical protein
MEEEPRFRAAPTSLPRYFKTGVLAVMPVYFPEFLPRSPEARLSQNQGYVVAIFIIDELMQRIANRTSDLKLDVMLLDSTQAGPETLMGARVDGRIAATSRTPLR